MSGPYGVREKRKGNYIGVGNRTRVLSQVVGGTSGDGNGESPRPWTTVRSSYNETIVVVPL